MLSVLKARLKTAECYKMENIITGNAEVDEKESEISQYCLGLPTILREILRYLSIEELIKLSLVNKLWNFEARSVMKERENLVANISSDADDQCQKLVALVSDLGNMRVIPFSGIYLHIRHHFARQPISNESLDLSYKVNLNRLPWKRFKVRFHGEWKHCKNCPALVLVKKILEDFCGVLEELSLEKGSEESYQSIFQDRRMPCLKILKVAPEEFYKISQPVTSAFIKMLVSRAPHLQELHIDGKIDLQENVLEGSSAVLVPTRTFRPLFAQVCEGLISSLRAKQMEILIPNDQVGPELLNRFVPMVLEASRTTLKTLLIDLNFAETLSYYAICLENVTSLYIYFNDVICDDIEEAFEELPRGLRPIFPKLNGCAILNDKGRCYLWLSQAPWLKCKVLGP